MKQCYYYYHYDIIISSHNYDAINVPSMGANIDVQKAVVGVYNCHENQGKEPLVIEELRPSLWRGSDCHMFPIDGSYTIREVPSLLKPLRDLTPLLRCTRALEHKT